MKIVDGVVMKKFSLCVKRIFDIVSSGICIIMLTPVWIGVSIAIKKILMVQYF